MYYPAVTTIAQAAPVIVASGDDRSGIDISLKFVPTSNISGRLLGPDGPVPNYMLHLVPTNTGEMTADPAVATAITDADGSFMFIGVPAGQYVAQTVRVPRAVPFGPPAPSTTVLLPNGSASFSSSQGSGPTPPALPSEPTLWAVAPISAGGQDLQDVTIRLQKGLIVSGRVEFEGTGERPPADRLSVIPIILEPADGKPRASTMPGRITPNGQFTTQGVPPGKYLRPSGRRVLGLEPEIRDGRRH
jgi:hypothetical protein